MKLTPYSVNGGALMYRRSGVKLYHGPQCPARNELSDFSWLCFTGCVQAISEAQDVD